MALSKISIPSAGKPAKPKVPAMKTQKAPSIKSPMSSYNSASKVPGMKGAISKYTDKLNAY